MIMFLLCLFTGPITSFQNILSDKPFTLSLEVEAALVEYAVNKFVSNLLNLK